MQATAIPKTGLTLHRPHGTFVSRLHMPAQSLADVFEANGGGSPESTKSVPAPGVSLKEFGITLGMMVAIFGIAAAITAPRYNQEKPQNSTPAISAKQ